MAGLSGLQHGGRRQFVGHRLKLTPRALEFLRRTIPGFYVSATKPVRECKFAEVVLPLQRRQIVAADQTLRHTSQSDLGRRPGAPVWTAPTAGGPSLRIAATNPGLLVKHKAQNPSLALLLLLLALALALQPSSTPHALPAPQRPVTLAAGVPRYLRNLPRRRWI